MDELRAMVLALQAQIGCLVAKANADTGTCELQPTTWKGLSLKATSRASEACPVLGTTSSSWPLSVTTQIQTTGRSFGTSSISGYCSDVGPGLSTNVGAPRTGVTKGPNSGGVQNHCWDMINDGETGTNNAWILGDSLDYAGVLFDTEQLIYGIGIARGSRDRYGGNYTVKVGSPVPVPTSYSTVDAFVSSASEGCTLSGSFTRSSGALVWVPFSEPVVASMLVLMVEDGASSKAGIDELRIVGTSSPR